MLCVCVCTPLGSKQVRSGMDGKNLNLLDVNIKMNLSYKLGMRSFFDRNWLLLQPRLDKQARINKATCLLFHTHTLFLDMLQTCERSARRIS